MAEWTNVQKNKFTTAARCDYLHFDNGLTITVHRSLVNDYFEYKVFGGEVSPYFNSLEEAMEAAEIEAKKVLEKALADLRSTGREKICPQCGSDNTEQKYEMYHCLDCATPIFGNYLSR